MNAFDLTGKTILITGASSGLGRQTALTVSEFGAKVVITGRDKKRLDETFQLLKGDGHLQLLADLTVQPEVGPTGCLSSGFKRGCPQHRHFRFVAGQVYHRRYHCQNLPDQF